MFKKTSLENFGLKTCNCAPFANLKGWALCNPGLRMGYNYNMVAVRSYETNNTQVFFEAHLLRPILQLSDRRKFK